MVDDEPWKGLALAGKVADDSGGLVAGQLHGDID